MWLKWNLGRGCITRAIPFRSLVVCFDWHCSHLHSLVGSCCSVTHFLSHVGSSQCATREKRISDSLSQKIQTAGRNRLRNSLCVLSIRLWVSLVHTGYKPARTAHRQLMFTCHSGNTWLRIEQVDTHLSLGHPELSTQKTMWKMPPCKWHVHEHWGAHTLSCTSACVWVCADSFFFYPLRVLFFFFLLPVCLSGKDVGSVRRRGCVGCLLINPCTLAGARGTGRFPVIVMTL